MISPFNRLKLLAFYRGTTTLVPDVAGDLDKARHIEFETLYPFGRYGPASFFVPRNPDDSWSLNIGQRIVGYNGVDVVYEGYVFFIDYVTDEGEPGRKVYCRGGWPDLMEGWPLEKPWADTDISNDVWVYQTGTTGAGDQSCTLDILNRLRFTPRGVAWANGDYAAVRRTVPVGQTIKRLTYNYDLQEAAQVWEISVWRSTDGAAWTQMTNVSGETYGTGTTTVIVASGTGSIDVTLATPSRYVELRFYSRAAQTPVEDGTYYGQWSSVTVYTETGSINLTEIAKDVRAFCTDLNSDETRIASNTYSLVPFGTDGLEPIGNTLQRASAYGDSSLNQWGCELWHSEWAATPNGEPVLAVDQYPVTTTYEYSVREHENKFRVTQNGEVINYVIVRYRNELGDEVYYTPDDDATLKDDTSIGLYGKRTPPGGFIDTGQSSQTTAVNWGKRVLAARKYPRWNVSGPIVVVGAIATKDGLLKPACAVSARERVQVANFLMDELAVADVGLTFVITHTKYVHDTQTLNITVGAPDELAVFLAQLNQ